MYDGQSYDVLGLACHLAEIAPVRRPDGHYTFLGEIGCLPPPVVQAFAFRDNLGRGLQRAPYWNARHPSLVELNDTGHTFSQIASTLLANPRRYFTKMA